MTASFHLGLSFFLSFVTAETQFCSISFPPPPSRRVCESSQEYEQETGRKEGQGGLPASLSSPLPQSSSSLCASKFLLSKQNTQVIYGRHHRCFPPPSLLLDSVAMSEIIEAFRSSGHKARVKLRARRRRGAQIEKRIFLSYKLPETPDLTCMPCAF